MSNPRSAATVYIIDDEDSVRRSLERLFHSAGLPARGFASVEDFLSADCPAQNACLISDIRLPGVSGLELPATLSRAGKRIPVIYVTAFDTAEARGEASRVGAAGFFRKPVDDQALLDAIEWAMAHDDPAAS